MADDEHIAVTSTVWVNVIEITQERDELRAEVERLRTALEGVLAEADRKTDAFDRAHAALERLI